MSGTEPATEAPADDGAGPAPCNPATVVPLVAPPAETAVPPAGLPVLATEADPDWVAGTTANTTRAKAMTPMAAAPNRSPRGARFSHTRNWRKGVTREPQESSAVSGVIPMAAMKRLRVSRPDTFPSA